ncbi:MAG TPA: cellulase family glycosylhydrolase [Ilumatobacteraceae bacterium]|nr:cellulase family glycosylhydrolase [Ilumatobacteraceae bacterium]
MVDAQVAPSALLVSVGAATATQPAQRLTSGVATGRFYVVGSDIIAPDGTKFIPIGANVGAKMVSWNPPTYAFTSQGHVATGHANDAVAWGWNTVRVNVVCNPGAGVTLQETINGVQALIDEYTPRHIVVMPECHDVTGADADLSDPRWVLIHQFWDAILAANGSNPYVWVNYVNEPYTGSAAGDPKWAGTAQTLYDRVRSKGTENLFVWEFTSWGQGADDIAGTDVGTALAAGKCNIVFSWHNYGAAGNASQMTSWATSLKSKGLAVIVGEVGYDWAGNRSQTTTYANDLRGAQWSFDNAYTLGFGVLYWHATGASAASNNLYSLRQNGLGGWYDTTAPLSAAGTRLLQLGTNKPAPTRPNVSLVNSHCASANG